MMPEPIWGYTKNFFRNPAPHEINEAVKMWNDGFSTFEISQALNIYESIVYNNLPKWRGKP